jgi:O-antigen/teichoic acid export membrane protein
MRMAGEEHSESAKPPNAADSARAARGLTAVSTVTLLSGLVTGPLLAHALGATGRGLLASVMVPLGVAPFIAQLGLGLFAVRASARGVAVSRLIGTLAVPLLVVGGAVALAAEPLAAALLPESEAARLWLRIGLTLLPFGLLANVLGDVLWGQQRWKPLIVTRLVSPVGLLTVTPILYVTDTLTVTSAAALAICLGILPLFLLLSVLPQARRPRPDRRLMREALGFGLRAWPGALADLANQRLDQLLMIPLLPPRELGLYAVATTVAVIGTTPASAIAAVVFPRIAAGQVHVLGPALRVTAVLLILTQGTLALAAPLIVPIAFGSSFAAAVPLVEILLLAWLLTALTPVLAHALAGSGHPGPGSIAQILGLTCTVIGLAISLPTLGATGAAITSVVAAAAVLGYLLGSTSRRLSMSLSELVRPRMTDYELGRTALRAVLSRRIRPSNVSSDSRADEDV